MFENTFRVVIIRCDVSSLSSSQLDTGALVAGIHLDPCPKTEDFGCVHFFSLGKLQHKYLDYSRSW